MRRVFAWTLLAVCFTLRLTGGSGNEWPAPRFEVRVETDSMVAMRDGVRLATDLYFPVGATGPLPVILIRTPYGKAPFQQGEQSDARHFAGQGYVVAVQDTRGRNASEGQYSVFAGDVTDGYDTTDWLSRQPWSNGKVGTFGCSYLGDVQILQAQLRHPSLKAMIPAAAGATLGSAGNRYYYFGTLKAGVMEIAMGLGWMANDGSKVRGRPTQRIPESALRKHFKTLPLVGMADRAGAPPSDWDALLTHRLTDPWWDQFGYLKDTTRFNVPAVHIGSWYDYGVAEVLTEFNLLRTNADSPEARNNQFAIIGPGTHCLNDDLRERTIIGQRDLGDARFGFRSVYLRWFDHWLQGSANDVLRMPKVMVYVMGRNEWRGEQEWPLARTKFTRYFLHSGGHANSLDGDGVLSTDLPGEEPPDHFTYDPADPVPSRGGQTCCTGDAKAEGSYDQTEIERRKDVLVYTSPVLKEEVEVTGPLKAVFYVSSSAKDTDFTAKLVDVYPDGRAFNIQEGIARVRYREGVSKEVWMEPGGVHEVTVDMEATSNSFGRGHRIRLEVSSSNFPRFDRNLNTGRDNFKEIHWIKARNEVHHAASRASYVLLPVVPPPPPKPAISR